MATAPKKKDSNGFVTVACKLPQGLHIHLPSGEHVKLHGIHSPYAVAGHGMTQVTVSTWELIQETFKDAKWLTSGAVFASGAPRDAAAQAKERKDERVGFEAIDPTNPNAGRAIGAIIESQNAP